MTDKWFLIADRGDGTTQLLMDYVSNSPEQANDYAEAYFLAFPDNPQDVPVSILIVQGTQLFPPAPVEP